MWNCPKRLTLGVSLTDDRAGSGYAMALCGLVRFCPKALLQMLGGQSARRSLRQVRSKAVSPVRWRA